MTPLPAGFGENELVAWRLDSKAFKDTWDSAEGAYQQGGRWNSAGVRAVYCSIDPATAILEVAAHKGFRTLDTVPHVLTSLTVADPGLVHVVRPDAVPNANWLAPGIPSARQQAFGDALLSQHGFVLLPSAVSRHSWNLIFDREKAQGAYGVRAQEDFVLDPRLHPAAAK